MKKIDKNKEKKINNNQNSKRKETDPTNVLIFQYKLISSSDKGRKNTKL